MSKMTQPRFFIRIALSVAACAFALPAFSQLLSPNAPPPTSTQDSSSLLAPQAAAPNGVQPLDRIIAVVNDGVILQSQLDQTMVSGQLAYWGLGGVGRWITVYANYHHVYMVVAGLRYDTSSGGDRWNQGSGPRWRKKKRKPVGFTAKYAPGY